MDSRDFQLLVALDDDAHQSYLSLGRRVSLSAPAVRDWLERLKDKHILQGFMLSIDPGVFGRDDLLLFFRGDFAKKTALRALAAPNVSWVAWKLDGRLTAGLWTKEEAKVTGHLAAILAAEPSWRAFTPRRIRAPVSIIDLNIMDALVDDPKMPFGELAKLTGLSPKTVRKHLDLLLETKAISIEPRLGALTDSGELIYQLLISGRVGMKEVREIMGETALTHHTQEPPMKYVLCRGSSLTDVTAKTRALEKVPGVESVTLLLNREVLVSTDLRHSLIRAEIRRLEKERVA